MIYIILFVIAIIMFPLALYGIYIIIYKTKRAYYENGNVSWECWMRFNKQHKRNGPSMVWYFKNGDVKAASWFINGERHNLYGPAIVEYDENRKVVTTEWRINNVNYSYTDWLKLSKLPIEKQIELKLLYD